jgi:hypothetical protein
MTISEIENKLKELKIAQSDVFKQKKESRDLDALKAIREEMNELKKKARSMYRA